MQNFASTDVDALTWLTNGPSNGFKRLQTISMLIITYEFYDVSFSFILLIALFKKKII